MLVKQGKLGEALTAFRDGKLVAQNNLPEALTSFRDGLAVKQRLMHADPGNVGLLRDTLVSHKEISGVLAAQGDLAEVLETFRNALPITEQLAQADPGNAAAWQIFLVSLHINLARNGDDEVRRWPFIVATLSKLKEENRLPPEQEKLLPAAEAQLARMVVTLRKLKEENRLPEEQKKWLPAAEEELAKHPGAASVIDGLSSSIRPCSVGEEY